MQCHLSFHDWAMHLSELGSRQPSNASGNGCGVDVNVDAVDSFIGY